MKLLNPVSFYRLARFLGGKHIPFIPRMIDYINRLIFSCWFPHTIKSGKGLVLGYGGLSIVVHSETVLGENVHIDQCVTIGGNAKQIGVPKIGNNVYIGAGAKILGPVEIGDDVVVGANAVVIRDVPDGSTAVGVPARILQKT